MTSANPIPLLDLSDPSLTAAELAKQVGHAVASVGFLHVKGIISADQVKNMFEISKELYDSPLEERSACPADGTNGWVGFRKSRLDESSPGGGDLKETFTYGRYFAPDQATTQPLPPVLVRRQTELQAFHTACHEATCILLDAFSVALNLPQTYFRERHSQGNNGLTLINYPPVPASEVSQDDNDVSRASAHKDWGSLTLLFQEENGTPGLEIFHEGKWWPAPIIKDTVLVNVGLALELWTGGEFTATLHRVITQQLPNGGFNGRRSTAYFVQPDDQVVFNTIRPDGTIFKAPEALTSREFFAERMRATTIAAN